MNPARIPTAETPAPFHPASSFDYLPREALRGLQSQRLRQQVAHAYEQVTLYRQRMHKQGVTPDEIRRLEDLVQLPFTTRADLSSENPLGMLAMRMRDVVRMHAADRAPGKPVVVFHTRRDLNAWHEVLARSLACAGLRPGDVVMNACAHHFFPEGLALHVAAESLDATLVPSTTGDVDRQIALLKEFGVSVILCTPSYFLYLLERAEKTRVPWNELSLRAAIFVGEPWGEDVRRRVEQAAAVRAYDVYGLPEILGPGIGAECCHQGLHLFEDHFYPEIIDPKTGQPVADGEEGELVLTALVREAIPLIRYRTGDRTALLTEPCPCGRTLRRIRRIERRSEETLAIQGVQVFPAQIEAVLKAVGGAMPPYRIVHAAERGVDRLEVQVEVTPQIFRDQVGAMEGLQERLMQEIERTVGVRVPVRFVEPHAITRSWGRPQRVLHQGGSEAQ